MSHPAIIVSAITRGGDHTPPIDSTFRAVDSVGGEEREEGIG